MSDTIEVGERVPNFRRTDSDGHAVTFYQRFCGRPVVLAVTRDWRAEAGALGRVEPPDERWELAVLIRGRPEDAAEAAAALPKDACVLADDGAVSDFLAETGGGPRILVLDANLRLLASLPTADAEALSAVYRRAATAPVLLASQAPVLIVPGVFEPEFCRHLIEQFHEHNEPSGVLETVNGKRVYREDPQTKIRREHRLAAGPLLAAVEHRLQRRVVPEIEWCFNFRVTHYEGVKVVLYDADTGGYFGPHRDNDGDDTAHRRFAMTVNHNLGQYDGGELRFPEYGDCRYATPSGAAIVFSCNLAHEAMPVERGRRFALVSFFYGAGDKLRPAVYEDQVTGAARGAPKPPRWG